MPARSSKTKSPAEKAVPVIVTAPGRQRTLSTKQQLLRKLLIQSHSPTFETTTYFSYFSQLDQEKVNKAKTAKDKAFQDAIRAQQKQEEMVSFWKLPVRAFPQPWLKVN